MNAGEVVASTGSPAFAVDRDGRILAWNDAAQESLGYRRNEVSSHRCYELLRGEDLFGNRYCGERCPLRERALLGGPINTTQMFYYASGGRRQLVSLSTIVVPGGASVGKALVHLVRLLPAGAEVPGGGVAGRREADNGNSRLSPREIEVLAQLGDGKGTQEVAEILCISPSTVRHHLQNLFAKLKVHSRLQAVALGRKL